MLKLEPGSFPRASNTWTLAEVWPMRSWMGAPVMGNSVRFVATAGELAEVVLIETTSSRVDELEVGRDKRQQGAEKQLDLHRGGVCV